MEKRKPINQRIEDLKAQIIATTDKHQQKKLLDTVLSLQRQADVVATELIVPVSEVNKSIDFGSCKISRTSRGYLFQAKGGVSTFVELRMSALCSVFETLFHMDDKEDKTEEDNELFNTFADAVLYIYQTPIFASLNEEMLFGVASDILRRFNEYMTEMGKKPLHEETEQDIKENEAFKESIGLIDALIKEPIPDIG